MKANFHRLIFSFNLHNSLAISTINFDHNTLITMFAMKQGKERQRHKNKWIMYTPRVIFSSLKNSLLPKSQRVN